MSFAFKIEFSGHKELEKALRELNPRVQRTVVRGALNKRATRIKRRIVNDLKKRPRATGALAAAFNAVKIGAIPPKNPDIFQGRGIAFPSRAEVGIGAAATNYYPMLVEFGSSRMPAYPYIRPAIDDHKGEDHSALAADIGKGIERAWARMAAKRARSGK